MQVRAGNHVLGMTGNGLALVIDTSCSMLAYLLALLATGEEIRRARNRITDPASGEARQTTKGDGPTCDPLQEQHEAVSVLVGTKQAHAEGGGDALQQAPLVDGVLHLLQLPDGRLVYALCRHSRPINMLSFCCT